MDKDFRITIPTLKILSVLYSDLDGEHYGFDLTKKTKLLSGTVYPILMRLEMHGIVRTEWEEVDPKEAGRGARKYYKLTAKGILRSREELEAARAISAASGSEARV